MSGYVFDSNIFITLHQRYSMDVFPKVWEKLEEIMANGMVISSQEVYDELLVGGDSLVEWVKKRKVCFYPTDVSIQQGVREILSQHRGLIEAGRKYNSADPFVIALAIKTQRIVVTEEAPTRNDKSPKIPDVCAAYQIGCVNFLTFARKEGFVF